MAKLLGRERLERLQHGWQCRSADRWRNPGVLGPTAAIAVADGSGGYRPGRHHDGLNHDGDVEHQHLGLRLVTVTTPCSGSLGTSTTTTSPSTTTTIPTTTVVTSTTTTTTPTTTDTTGTGTSTTTTATTTTTTVPTTITQTRRAPRPSPPRRPAPISPAPTDDRGAQVQPVQRTRDVDLGDVLHRRGQRRRDHRPGQALRNRRGLRQEQRRQQLLAAVLARARAGAARGRAQGLRLAVRLRHPSRGRSEPRVQGRPGRGRLPGDRRRVPVPVAVYGGRDLHLTAAQAGRQALPGRPRPASPTSTTT